MNLKRTPYHKKWKLDFGKFKFSHQIFRKPNKIIVKEAYRVWIENEDLHARDIVKHPIDIIPCGRYKHHFLVPRCKIRSIYWYEVYLVNTMKMMKVVVKCDRRNFWRKRVGGEKPVIQICRRWNVRTSRSSVPTHRFRVLWITSNFKLLLL